MAWWNKLSLIIDHKNKNMVLCYEENEEKWRREWGITYADYFARTRKKDDIQ